MSAITFWADLSMHNLASNGVSGRPDLFQVSGLQGASQVPPLTNSPPNPLSAMMDWIFADLPMSLGQQVVEFFWICLVLATGLGMLAIVRFVVLARPLLVTLILRLSLLSLFLMVSYRLYKLGEWPIATTMVLIAILLTSQWWASFQPKAILKAWRYQPVGFRLRDWARSWGIQPLRSRGRGATPSHQASRQRTGIKGLFHGLLSARWWMALVGRLLLFIGTLLTALAKAIEQDQKATAAKNAQRRSTQSSSAPPKPSAASAASFRGGGSKAAPPPQPRPKPAPPPPPPPPPPKGGMSQVEALKLLGLPIGATVDQIRSAHRRLMIRHHPDHGGDALLAARLNQAKDVLLDR
ncbi:MAG: hypothetical protein FJX22_01790 [Alphaproteobacteria bacterium]|nr:hypothetical protein [Alphaproteobacteria bacterium]